MSGRTNRRKGAEFERAVVSYLRAHGAPHAERAGGGHDQAHGDVVGVPGLYVECRNRAKIDLAAWTAEVSQAAGERLGLLVVKRRGTLDPAKGYTVLTLSAAVKLLAEAGYLEEDVSPA